MGDIRSQRVVATLTVRGREFEVLKTTWRGTSGLSFDVSDKETEQALHNESFDDQPDEAEVKDLLDQLREDLDSNTLDPFFAGDEATLRQIVGPTPVPQEDTA